ncbi:MAG TPA: DUF4290 domain-containing protein [Salinivirgaceae bacterium]|nr:DUF4290 domain-containing protein [Salinivirgaceae bacterium]HQA75912.1 DUF4290 domain-containing protein [Salinivirgaceae bacterium]
MDYNTEREKLIMPEYGRYIHQYAQYIKTIESRQERTQAAHALISIMATLNPGLRDSSDYRRKLWDHLMIIADYELDVDNPYPMPDRAMLEERPSPVKYDFEEIDKRHYGKLIERMAKKIEEYEGEEREVLISLVANTMKKNYLNWNKNAVSDSTILQDLRRYVPKSVEIPDDLQLLETRDLVNRPASSQRSNSKTQQKHRSRRQNKKSK